MKASITIPKKLDYEEIGLKVGLEIHQQLATSRKLFCNCRPVVLPLDRLRNAPRIRRELRVGRSELGEVDVAAAFEIQRKRVFEYIAPREASCLVELDEEPPHDLSREALVIALAIALAMHSLPVDEVHVMRKIVVDGSNTTGFQRTAIVALGGYVDCPSGRVRIQTVTLEEDAARKIEERGNVVIYSLDRLGIPLVEISTAPDIRSPQHAKEAAETIGTLMRLTYRVRRGLGTIRQDINLSIRGSPKIEIKGIQRLDLLPKVVANEARRLYGLLRIRDELRKRGATSQEVLAQQPVDVTDIVKDCNSKIIKSAIRRGERAYALKLPKFDGLLGVELQEGRRFGTELADYVRQWTGLKGLIHSDELPGYGIAEDAVKEIRRSLEAADGDAFVIVLGPKTRALRALEVVRERAAQAIEGIPKETRAANDDGTTRYLRPQPGAARMYPETDIPPIRITSDIIEEAKKIMPPLPSEKLAFLRRAYNLSEDLARQLLLSEYLPLFENLAKSVHYLQPSLVASIFTSLAGELRKDGIDISMLSDDVLREIVLVGDRLRLGKEAIMTLLREAAVRGIESPQAVAQLAKELGLESVSEDEIRQRVRTVIDTYRQEILKRGNRAFSFVMGKVMGELRGKADGKLVARIVQEELRSLRDSN